MLVFNGVNVDVGVDVDVDVGVDVGVDIDVDVDVDVDVGVDVDVDDAAADDDDIYIMMHVCLFVTKNDHFLLGVSCDHLNPP